MKGFKYWYVFLFLFMVTPALALKTKFDPNIYVNELREAGIRNISKVQSDLDLDKSNKEQKLVVKHVITTGSNKADRNYVLVNISTLEKIQPPISGLETISRGKQITLTDAQVDSILDMLNVDDANQKWLKDKQKHKYVNVVLQVEDAKDNKISPLTTKEAGSLVKWAIKHDRLDAADHPTNEKEMS